MDDMFSKGESIVRTDLRTRSPCIAGFATRLRNNERQRGGVSTYYDPLYRCAYAQDENDSNGEEKGDHKARQQ
jgi:hypothetical protein